MESSGNCEAKIMRLERRIDDLEAMISSLLSVHKNQKNFKCHNGCDGLHYTKEEAMNCCNYPTSKIMPYNAKGCKVCVLNFVEPDSEQEKKFFNILSDYKKKLESEKGQELSNVRRK